MAARKKPAPSTALAPAGAPVVLPALALPEGFERAAADVLALAEQYHDLGTIDTPDEYAIVDAGLQRVVRAKDAFVAMRQGCVGAMRKVVAAVEAEFRPGVRALEAAESACKAALGAYRLAEAKREQEARAQALAAAKAGDAEALTDALTTASAASAGANASGTATVSARWVVKRVNADLLPDEYWSPDMTKIANEAERQGTRRDEPPVIPGVIFELEARVGARR